LVANCLYSVGINQLEEVQSLSDQEGPQDVIPVKECRKGKESRPLGKGKQCNSLEMKAVT
jgi:hypothetical protein